MNVTHDMSVLSLALGNAADLPASGEFDGDVVRFLKRKFKVDGVNTIGVFKDPLLVRREKADWKNCVLAGARPPPRNLQIELGNQWSRSAGPFRFIGQLHFNGRWNLLFDFIL